MDLNSIRDLLFIGEKEIEICGITLYSYTIREIYRMGKDNFKKIMYFSVLQPIDFFKRSEVKKSDFDGIETFDMLSRLNQGNIDWCCMMLSLATKKEWKYNKTTNMLDCIEFIDGKPKIIRINRQQYLEISKAISVLYGIQRYDAYEKYGDFDKAEDFVKKVIEEEIEKEAQEHKNSNVTISSIVEAIACHSDSGFNANTIGDITIYQLARIYERIQQKDTYANHMRALYSGCMSKESKINFEDIHWAKNLNDI